MNVTSKNLYIGKLPEIVQNITTIFTYNQIDTS